MATPSEDMKEVCLIDSGFIVRLTLILNKHWNQSPVFALSDLLRDLCVYLGARATICVQVDTEGQFISQLFHPQSAENLVDGVLKDSNVQASANRFLNEGFDFRQHLR